VAAKKRQHTQRIAPFEHGQGGKPRIDERRRARYLLSGLTRCGYCGGYAMISADMLGCSTARNKGTCANRVNIRRDVLEQRVLTSLHTHLIDPALFAQFCDEFTGEFNSMKDGGHVTRDSSANPKKRAQKTASGGPETVWCMWVWLRGQDLNL
jgi:site-specific DNA recombinase